MFVIHRGIIMMISTKGRYALRVMVDLAQHKDGSFIALNDIAERQNISKKYLESIVAALTKAGILDSVRGKGGGYRLVNDLDTYTIARVLKATENTIAPVSCIANGTIECDRRGECPTLSMWQDLNKLVENYFENATIADLINGKFKVE